MRALYSMLALVAVAVMMPTASLAETHVVEMLNKDPDDPKKRMVYRPTIVYAKPGDTVKFVSKDRGHNVQSIKGMLPEGAEKFRSKINKDFELKLDASGVYGYRCTPHYAAGMVGVIVVEGDNIAETLAEARKARKVGRSKKVFKELLDQVEAKLKETSDS